MINVKVTTLDKLNIAEESATMFQLEGPGAVEEASDAFLDAVQLQLSRTVDAEVGPDEDPTMRTGELRTSFKKLPLWVFQGVLVGGIYSDHPGASRLEWGRIDSRGIRTFPHPYLMHAARAVDSRITDIFDRRVVTK